MLSGASPDNMLLGGAESKSDSFCRILMPPVISGEKVLDIGSIGTATESICMLSSGKLFWGLNSLLMLSKTDMVNLLKKRCALKHQ